MINKLVLSGGGPAGFAMFGAIRKLVEESAVCMDKVDSIHATSCGGIVGAAIMMNYSWETLHDYFVLRPWKDCDFKGSPIITAWNSGGLLTGEAMAEVLAPLLSAKGMERHVTMGDFCEACGKRLTVYATDISGAKLNTVPLDSDSAHDERLCDVLAASAAIPGLFAPVRIKDWLLLDGCLLQNFPLDSCIERESCDPSSVLGVRLDAKIMSSIAARSNSKATVGFVELVLKLMACTASTLSTHYSQKHDTPRRVLHCEVPIDGAKGFIEALNSQGERERLVAVGTEAASNFIARSSQNHAGIRN